ncbi:SMI1/KNR4 family protein [Paenibacillus rhizovicinus]|uniref:SMI1/KNR4 family protein n=1 Tax=Paenibacillus rhizovicinus TaxID=2704463 RepID=A0A6C0NXN8_9BACL|nr:SMI1/KNR4 family protein [Paenibacillus rhizovicinus]QHW30969.1 SMI1/KNR4 family protein [Paenibacillus rhizovicinus]
MDSVIMKSLESLKNRLTKEGITLRFTAEGSYSEVKFTFNPPATQSEINNYMTKWSITLPEDYLEFLRIHDGGSLFASPEYGGGIELLSLERIDELYSVYDDLLPKGWIPVAVEEGEEFLFIDTNSVCGRDYTNLYWCELADVRRNPSSLNANFELWFDRFIIAEGNKYCTWMWMKPEIYYKYRK